MFSRLQRYVNLIYYDALISQIMAQEYYQNIMLKTYNYYSDQYFDLLKCFKVTQPKP